MRVTAAALTATSFQSFAHLLLPTLTAHHGGIHFRCRCCAFYSSWHFDEVNALWAS